ncbi:hypothetical protein M514_02524 [Trichuris suis]|uniref:Uncharacterized protein n=1 Tax=Trichuris suis TaxID=68888 RepID=A0A085MGS4_9BILA|nr:hypothetical protein M513_02524 [Trichuris suis]KFD70948.1 hypothetical protein M514_02524 [Trichuris suis]
MERFLIQWIDGYDNRRVQLIPLSTQVEMALIVKATCESHRGNGGSTVLSSTPPQVYSGDTCRAICALFSLRCGCAVLLFWLGRDTIARKVLRAEQPIFRASLSALLFRFSLSLSQDIRKV